MSHLRSSSCCPITPCTVCQSESHSDLALKYYYFLYVEKGLQNTTYCSLLNCLKKRLMAFKIHAVNSQLGGDCLEWFQVAHTLNAIFCCIFCVERRVPKQSKKAAWWSLNKKNSLYFLGKKIEWNRCMYLLMSAYDWIANILVRMHLSLLNSIRLKGNSSVANWHKRMTQQLFEAVL